MKLDIDKTKIIFEKGYNLKNIAFILFASVFFGVQIFWLHQNIYASVLIEQGLDQQSVEEIINTSTEVSEKETSKSNLVLIDEPEGNVWETVQVEDTISETIPKIISEDTPGDISDNTDRMLQTILPPSVKNDLDHDVESTNQLPIDNTETNMMSPIIENLEEDKKDLVDNVKIDQQPNQDQEKWEVDSYLYKSPSSQVELELSKMVEGSEEKDLISKIASQPQSMRFGDEHQNIEESVNNFVSSANKESKLPVLVLYNIPKRDCFGYSGGGAKSEEDYRNWINAVKKGISSHKAMVILEPDALAGSDCLSLEDKEIRYDLVKYGVEQLSSDLVSVYIDAGHSNWIGVQDMSQRLSKSGISKAKGFSLNVSNFYTNDNLITYGRSLNQKLGGGKTFVIDTSRNGNGPTKDFQWCNPRGRALGSLPTLNTGIDEVDAFLWIKVPGESDGPCNGGPPAGVWWLDYALELVRNSKY